jgi:hypothetical protein
MQDPRARIRRPSSRVGESLRLSQLRLITQGDKLGKAESLSRPRSPSRGGLSRACGAAPLHADPPVLGVVLGLAAPPPVAQTALEQGTLPGIMRGGGRGCQAQT